MAFIVLISGIVGGLLIVFSILLLCKYCLNRKNLREAEQMKLLYETLNQATVLDSNRFYHRVNREFAPLEPRRSNPLDRYQLPDTQWQIPRSKPVLADYHTPGVQGVYNQLHHDNREQNSKNIKQLDPHGYGNIMSDDEPAEHYLQVDPRCYVRQKSMTNYKRPETPRLEKGHSINVDTRPSPSPTSLSPYRQSSFDVVIAHRSQNQPVPSTPSPAMSTQQEIFFTPRGSSLSVMGNISTGTPPGSQHLSPPMSFTSRQNSMEKKDLAVTLDASGRESLVRSSIVQREHEHSRSLEHSSQNNNNYSTVDKQSRSFDAVHLLKPDIHREDAMVNRRTKSYECADEPLPSVSPVAPAPIVIKIPDMRELVQAAHLSRLQKKESNGYSQNSTRKSTRTHQIIINNHHHPNEGMTSDDLWRYDYDEQQQLDGTSPEDLSPDLLTSTSIDSAGAMAIHQNLNTNNHDDDPSKYEHRRKSSSNLLLPPPEVRRQALRRTFEKRRRCINQSNARREEQLSAGLDDDYEQNNQSSITKSTQFSSLLNNFNSKSENSSFDRSLETDFDMQSDTSSREPNDHFTSIESSCNENILPDIKQHLPITQQKQSSQQDDSGYKSLESQHSQNHTFSLDWASADGVESVIYVDQASKKQEKTTDFQDEPQMFNRNQIIPNIQPSYPQNSDIIEQRNVSPKINSSPNRLVTSTSFNRTASKRRKEFGKDKRHASSNTGLPNVITPDEYQSPSPIIHQVNEVSLKQTSPSTLKVRQADFRRSKSDESEIISEKQSIFINRMHLVSPIDSSIKKQNSHFNESPKPPAAHHSPSADAVLSSKQSSYPIRLHNPVDSRHLFQRSPSSTTPPVAVSPQIIAFRSKRGSISFDTPVLPIHSPTSNLPTSVIKPRLKFSMVRDTTTASLGSNTPSYSMPLANDLTIDEKTNRIINEFLMRDNNVDVPRQESPPKHRHQQIRQNTFDETIKQTSRTALTKHRQHSFIQPTKRQQIPLLHLVNAKNNFESPSLTFTQQSDNAVRRDNGMAVSSPSIIVTGYDSGS